MNRQPDQLFHDKLVGYQRAIPGSAWQKIDANLQPKAYTSRWMKIAASVAIILGTASWFVLKQNATEAIVIAKTEVSKKTAPIKQNNEVPIAEHSSAPVIAMEETEKQPATITPEREIEKAEQPREAISVPVAEVVATIIPEVVDVQLIEEPVAVQIVEPEVVEVKSMTLVLSADEVNAKYLDKKTGEEATPVKQKSSTLQKLLSKARRLKHNQDPLGELRQKKNEILAFNLSSEKERTLNR